MAASKPIAVRKRIAIWKRGGLTFRQLAGAVARGSHEHDLVGRASGLAFDFLFALFPFLLFLISLFALFAAHSPELQASLLASFARFLPPEDFQLLSKVIGELVRNSGGGILTFGFLAAIWFSSSGVSSMISTLNAVYQVGETRSWLKVRGIALGLTLLISASLFSALVLILIGGEFADWLGKALQIGPAALMMWKALQWPAAAAFVTFSYSLIYYFGPALQKPQRRWVTPGSLFSVVLWLVSAAGFRIYLHFFNSYNATYGSLGAVMILLAWLYLAALAFLIGGEINAQIERASIT